MTMSALSKLRLTYFYSPEVRAGAGDPEAPICLREGASLPGADGAGGAGGGVQSGPPPTAGDSVAERSASSETAAGLFACSFAADGGAFVVCGAAQAARKSASTARVIVFFMINQYIIVKSAFHCQLERSGSPGCLVPFAPVFFVLVVVIGIAAGPGVPVPVIVLFPVDLAGPPLAGTPAGVCVEEGGA